MVIDEYSYGKPEKKDQAIETAKRICWNLNALDLRLTKAFQIHFQVSEKTCHIHYVSDDKLGTPEYQVEYEAFRKLIEFINSWL